MKPKGTANIMHVNKRVITVKFQIKYTLLRVYDPYLTKYCINPGRFALFRLFFVEILSIIAFTNSIHVQNSKRNALEISAQSLMGIPNLVKHAH